MNNQIHALTVAVGLLALIGITIVAHEDACTWGWLQFAGTVITAALVGASITHALKELNHA